MCHNDEDSPSSRIWIHSSGGSTSIAKHHCSRGMRKTISRSRRRRGESCCLPPEWLNGLQSSVCRGQGWLLPLSTRSPSHPSTNYNAAPTTGHLRSPKRQIYPIPPFVSVCEETTRACRLKWGSSGSSTRRLPTAAGTKHTGETSNQMVGHAV